MSQEDCEQEDEGGVLLRALPSILGSRRRGYLEREVGDRQEGAAGNWKVGETGVAIAVGGEVG